MTAALLSGPRTLDALMVQAHALEREAAQRYLEFAEIMEAHNNGEVAELFRSFSAQETRHAEEIRARMGWSQAPWTPGEPEAPHVPELERAHYLMQPWHALQLAIEAETRAHDFFESIARTCEDAEIRSAAAQLQAEELEHVELLRTWLERVPEPPPGWDDDPDPPRYTD